MISDHLREEDALLQEWRSFGSPLHEFAGVVLTRRLASQIAENIRGLLLRVYEADPDDGTWAGVAHSVVAGEIDVDRLDYLMRDAQKAGTEFGAIDHLRLIDSLELHFDGERFRIAPGVRGRSAVETLLMQRSQSYKWITYHHRVVGSNLALARAVETLRSLSAADDVVRVDNREQALSGWFGGHVPNLNYLAPTLMDITTALTPERENEEQQLTLEDHLQADWVRGVVDQLRGSVDDGAVIEWLRRGSLLARALLHRGTLTEPLRVRLLEFVAYSEAAMFRVKNFMPTWKTVEEFAGAAYEMGPALLAATIEAFDTLIDRLEGAPRELVVAIREQREHLTEAIKGDPVAGSNRLLALTASTVSQAELLRYALQEQRNEVLGVPGFWDVQYTSFKPVRMAGNLTVLYRDDLPYTLLEHSPLVQSLEDVERHRPKLFAFFFLRSSVAFSAFDKDKVREVRAALTGEFISTFPQFVRRHLADSLFATFNGGHDA